MGGRRICVWDWKSQSKERRFSIHQESAAVICDVFLGCQFSQEDIYMTCGGLVNLTFRL